MKKIAGTLALAFVIYIAFLQFCGVSTVSNFSVAGYFERLEQIEPMPDLPSLNASISEEDDTVLGTIKGFFRFLFDAASYPFRVLIWFVKTANLILFTDTTDAGDPSWSGGGEGDFSGGGGFGGGGGHSW